VGTPHDVVAGGRVYTVVDDLSIQHRLVFRGQLRDQSTTLAISGPVRVRPLHPSGFAVVGADAEYLVAVDTHPPAVLRIRLDAPGYESKTVALAVPAAGSVTVVNLSLKPRPA
jgi:hypothetical protein